MAKPPMMVHVQSSDFKSLLEAQRQSVEIEGGMLEQSIVQTIHSDMNGMTLRHIKEIVHAQLKGQQDYQESKEKVVVEVQKKQLKVQEDTLEQTKVSVEELKRIKSEEAEAIANIAQTVRTFTSLGDRLKNFGSGLKEKFSGGNFKTTMLKAVNVGGFLDKKIAERDFVQQQRKLGSDKSDKELREDFATRNDTAKQIKKNEGDIEKFKKETGLNDKQLASTKEGQRLLAKRESLSDTFAKTDMRAGLVTRAEPAGTPLSNAEQNDAVNVSEEEMNSARREEANNTLLEKIEKNTEALNPQKAKAGGGDGGDGGGNGILAGIGEGFGKLGGGIGKFMESVGKGAGAGIRGLLMGIAQGLAAFANPATLIGLGAVTLAIMGIGKALEMAAPGIEAFAVVAEKVIAGISDGIVKIIDEITTSIERLADVDGMNLMSVGAGLVAVAGGMVAFSAANVAGGIGNLVGGLLSKVSGQKTPVEQIVELGQHGQNIEKAGIGVEKLGTGLKMFSDIKPENIKAIAALPTDKIVAMGVAMSQAGLVSSQSAANDDARTAATSGGGNKTTAVNAPTTNISNSKQVVQLPIRNQEQTMSRYIRNQY